MKKLTCLILLSLIFLLSMSAMAQDEGPVPVIIGDWEAVENDTGWTLNAYHGSDINIEVPDTLEDKPVTQLAKEIFMNNMTLESVVIPNSVTAIGANAFNGCIALKNVQLSSSIKRIENGLFRYCMSLEQITVPMTVTAIGTFAFADCINLKEIILLAVTSIGESAFDNCQMLTNVVITNKLATVNGRAFRDTPWLNAQTDEFVIVGKGVLINYNGNDANVEIPYGVTFISSAFEENYIVENVIIPDTVKQIGQFAFREAANLRSINIPEFVTTIGGSAFEGCRKLSDITFPSGLKTISGSAFRYCDGLENVIIPSAVTNLPSTVFGDCSNLTEVVVPASVTTIHKNAFANSANVILQVAYGSVAEELAKEYEIPYEYALQEYNDFVYSQDADNIYIVKYTGNLYDVEVPAAINGTEVTSIETAAFQNNRSVRRLILPITVRTIGDWAFSYMESLEYIQLPAGIQSIGANAFTGSDALVEIKLPAHLTEIGSSPFDIGTATKICAQPDSTAAQLLQSMGYAVQPENTCADDTETMSLWAELKTLGVVSATCDCGPSTQIGGSESYEIIRIPDDITTLTANLISYAGDNVLLVIPSSVTSIDNSILNGRTVTIIGDAGSAAEAFARENDIRFSVRVTTWMNLN